MITLVAKAIVENDKNFTINNRGWLTSLRSAFYNGFDDDGKVQLLAWRVEKYSDTRWTIRRADQSLFDSDMYPGDNQYFVRANLGVPPGTVKLLTDDMMLIVIGPKTDLVINAKRNVAAQAVDRMLSNMDSEFRQSTDARKIAAQFVSRLLIELEARWQQLDNEELRQEVAPLLLRDNAIADLRQVATICLKMVIDFDDLVRAVLQE